MEWLLICTLQVALLSTSFCIPPCKHYLNRRKEGVFHYDRHMRYQLTYFNAQHACVQDFGGKLATRDQLSQALKSGLEECRAGWITLAEVAYPRINSHWNCGFNKTGLISYGIRQNLHEKWDVFCYKDDDDCSHYNLVYFGVPFGTLKMQTSNPSPTSAPKTTASTFTSDPLASSLSSLTSIKNVSLLQEMLTSEPLAGALELPAMLSEHHSFTENELVENQEKMSVSTDLGNPTQKYKDVQNSNSKNVQVPKLVSYISESEVNSSNIERTVSSHRTEATTNIMISTIPLKSFPNRHDIRNPGINEHLLDSQFFGIKEIDNLSSQSLPTTPHSPDLFSKVFESTRNIISEQKVMPEIGSKSNVTPVPKAYFPNSNFQTETIPNMTNVPIIFATQEDTTAENVLQNSSNSTKIPSEMFSGTEQDFIITANSKSTPLTPLFTEKQLDGKAVGESTDSFYTNLFQLQPEKDVTVDFNGVSNTNGPYTSTDPQANQPATDNKSQADGVYKQNEGFTVQPTTFNLLNLQKTEQSFSPSESSSLSYMILTSISGKHNTAQLSKNEKNDSLTGHLTPKEIRTEDAIFSATEQPTITYTHRPVTTSDTVEEFASTIQTDLTTYSLFSPSPQLEGTINPESKMAVTDTHVGMCGGLLRGVSGQFNSPGFPQSYEKDMNCSWVIEAPLGHTVILEFLSLAIEAHRKCEYDYVIVYDGKEHNNNVLGRFCGSQHPPQMRSASNVVTVIMRSDSSVELDGFSLRFSTMQSTSGIRLVGGKNSFEGIVEVDYQGFRGTVCPKHWSNKDAKVVCRQLGFQGPAIATRIIGEDSVLSAISSVNCNGSEAVLENCNIKMSGTCDTKERAGVICQVYESCAALKNVGVQESGIYMIDPDGVDQGVSHFYVECDMESDHLTGITIVGHDAENKERVIPCREPGCYSRTITYKTASLAQLRSLTSASESCEQFVKLDCRYIRFLDGPWGWWVSRDGEAITSWGGAPTNSGRCACGENGDCAFEMTSCNCDANDDVWRTDEGFITDKSSLPIKEIRFGVTDIIRSMAFYQIGKLRCLGTKPPILESCAALKEAGISESGKYVIDPDGVDKGLSEFEVFCDMSSQSGITVIGHDGERRIPVSPCEDPGCYKREFVYSADLAQLNALTKVSQSCEQFVRLDCRHVRFIQSGWGWWDSWNGEKMDYWGGADPSVRGCACGKTGTCAFPDKLCNCDSNDNIWRTDDGFLRDKRALPIKAVYFGDTNNFPLEMAYHSIGKLRCRGRAKKNEDFQH
ncbi:uncharacterized protein LOC120940562 isoform X2 [Rana temporaria]|uniref:uncharacterized protein LOC120940562 isoform X2 n=1 Tax=Rana temporaria TaxID=8407 RepID=UPI001AAD8B57|nr:uncharacterized protein LOC120940562 isoform X2 [Rana temporaria]